MHNRCASTNFHSLHCVNPTIDEGLLGSAVALLGYCAKVHNLASQTHRINIKSMCQCLDVLLPAVDALRVVLQIQHIKALGQLERWVLSLEDVDA